MKVRYKKIDDKTIIDALNFAYCEMVYNKQIEDKQKNKLIFSKLNLLEYDNNTLWMYGAFNKNDIVGVIGFTNMSINLLFVNDKYRNNGIASNLLNIAINDLKQKGINKIKLDATKEGYDFYKNRGFIESKTDNSKYINMNYTIKGTSK